MKALPSAMWNRAIPENDYIQLGTLRYGVRLSNTGLLDGGKPDHVSDLTEANSRASVTSSYELTNGDNSVHSVGGTSSISSNGDKQNCCCIGSGGVEMPWTNSFARTKLPVPTKNRKSSPFASTSVGSTGADGHHHHQQQQLPRYPMLAPGRTNNNGTNFSQSTQSHDHGSDGYACRTDPGIDSSYRNGVTHNKNSKGDSDHNGSSFGTINNGNGTSDHQQLFEDTVRQLQQQQADSSPRCSTVVCCYSNSFGSGSTNKKRHNGREKHQLQESPPKQESKQVRSYRKQQPPSHDRSIGYSTNATLDVRHHEEGSPDYPVRSNGAPHSAASGRTYVRSEFDDANDADVDDDLSALVIVGANGGHDTVDGDGVISSGSTGGDYRNGGDDLNLNSKNALRQQQQQQQHLVPQQGWPVQQGQGGRKDVNINNFEKKNISSDGGVGVGSGPNSTRPISSRSGDGGVGGGRNNIRKKHSSSIGSGLGSDLGVDELSPTPPVSPRPSSTSPQQASCVLTHSTSESPVGGSSASSVQAHPPPIATPFGQRRRILQPPSSLPVVKSYSFHRVPSDAIGYCSPTIASRSPIASDCSQQLFDGAPIHTATGRNRSFRSANHARRLQYGYLDDSFRVEKPNGFLKDEIGGEALYFRPNVTRKSSLPVLGSGGSAAGSIRNHKCSDAINEIRLQSLNKYCNKLLSAATGTSSRAGNDANLPTVIAGGTHGRARPIDELEDLSFIDSSDLSSAGDDIHHNATLLAADHADDWPDKCGHECRPQRKQYRPSVIATGSAHHGTTPAVASEGDGTLPAAVDGGSKALAASTVAARVGASPANRNNYIDSSSDELNSVCSGVEQLTLACDGAESHRRNSEEQWRSARPSTVKCRTQCNRNDSNASDDYQAARHGAELRFGSALQSVAAISTLLSALDSAGELGAGSSGHGEGIGGSQEVTVGGGGSRRSDTNNNYHRNNSNGDSEQHQQQQLQHQQQHHQQQQQQKYTTVPSNNSAEKSVSVGGVGGEPGRPPGGIGEQTPLGRAATDDSYPSASSPYATVKTLGYSGSACSSPDSPSAHHAGLNCFGRSNTQFHAAASGTNDRSIMEKRNNTLDRLQRLVKKTTSSSSDKQNSSAPGTSSNAVPAPGATKTERLRELTELLKGNRAPPVPPPRRSKHANSVERTLDRRNTALSTSSLNDTSFLHGAESNLPELLKAKESRSVDIPYRFADGSGQRMSTPSSPLAEHKPINIRANVSTSNLEALHELPPPASSTAAGEECKSEMALKDDDELFAKLSRPESRTIVGSYTQKTIPFRSASFSQVDYSSGKYIRSALGALKNSIMKSKDQQQTSVDSNTIPRQYCKVVETARSCSPTELCGNQLDREVAGAQTDDTDVAKLTIKKTELNINLAPLDDYGIDVKDLSSNRNSDIETIVEDPVAEHNENVENEGGSVSQQANISVMQASEMVLEPLVEEGIPITPTSLSKDDECLQQATTCLIPVPVYDCVVSEWSTARPSEQWIDASTTEYGKFTDCLGSIKEVNENALSETPGQVDLFPAELSEEGYHAEKITVETPPRIIEPQESVELSEDGVGSDGAGDLNEGSNGSDEGMMICTPPVSIICTEPESNEFTTIVDGSAATHKVSVVLGDGNDVVEVVEVRKRHSNNEDMGDPQNCRLSNDVDEKRRLESRKSRRKGIYIQWPAIDGNNELESDHNDNGGTAGEEGTVAWNPQHLGQVVNEKDSSLDLSGDSFTDLCGKDVVEYAKERENTVNSPERYLLDPTTPDSDPGKPIWPKGNRRQSLTYQSSDEKDDAVPAPALPVRTLKTLLLRSDSVSDNESDRASSRDRTSASPAPGGGDSDFRRYSKRPLRGPYGQMLEAEMKKPTSKVQYSEILEELTRNEGNHSPSPGMSRNRGAGSQSMDETNDRHAAKAGSKPRKTSANLPVPTHVRTASSPSKLSDSSSSHSASPSKRYLCNIEQRSTDSDKSEKSTSGGGGGKLENKKFSLDSHLTDKSLKRGGSDVHEKPNKQRSGSSASDKQQQKRSLDEVRLSQNSRTPSERSFTLLNTPDTPKGLAASPELLAELLKGSSEKLVTEQLTGSGGNSGANASNALPSAVLNCLDTRTHVVVELFNTEKSYVESLQTIVLKYLNQLKSPENSGLVDVQTVDEIFFMVPAILNIHERFLEELRRRLDSWDKMQMIGDAFVDVFSRPVILDTYTAFVNNWNRAKDAIRSARQKCPAFARFLEAMAREHKGKLSLDNLLIKPVQKFPNYELIFTRLIKHTDVTHPDQKPLQEALKLVHDILMFLNCKEKEALENGQRETALRELEGVIEGMNDLVTPERAFLLFDLVSMPSGQVTRKERGFFLFNDLLVITSIKRRSGTIRKTNMTCPGSVASTLDTNKYKYLTKISLDDLEIVKCKYTENLNTLFLFSPLP
uniref:Uncharacterized protein n=1 Tax=Anopheles stephensi TaxID=30069 RepID=A0A182XX47_ANOST